MASPWADERHPKNQLPHEGPRPFRPADPSGKIESRRGRPGYPDSDGNVWEWDGRRSHWDVQHADGRHTNVRPDGTIDHGPDNFP